MDEPTAPAPVTLGTLVRHARERAGLSLRHLEAITSVPRNTLHRLERDQLDTPSPVTLQRLADALELNRDDLFAFVGYRPSATLPSLAPYLRAKYQLPPDAAAEAHEALQGILERYDRTPAAERPQNTKTKTVRKSDREK